MDAISVNDAIGLILKEIEIYKEGLQRLENAAMQLIGKIVPQNSADTIIKSDGMSASNCQMILRNFESLTPKPEFPAVLENYRMLLGRCNGPQYTDAVNEINNILRGLEGSK